jgi:hypothetical protein
MGFQQVHNLERTICAWTTATPQEPQIHSRWRRIVKCHDNDSTFIVQLWELWIPNGNTVPPTPGFHLAQFQFQFLETKWVFLANKRQTNKEEERPLKFADEDESRGSFEDFSWW